MRPLVISGLRRRQVTRNLGRISRECRRRRIAEFESAPPHEWRTPKGSGQHLQVRYQKRLTKLNEDAGSYARRPVSGRRPEGGFRALDERGELRRHGEAAQQKAALGLGAHRDVELQRAIPGS